MLFLSLLRFSAVGASASLLFACNAPARPSPLPVSGWTISQSPASWKVEGFEEDMDLSGIATLDQKTVLLGSDEMIAAQAGTMNKAAGLIKAGDLIQLMQNPSGDRKSVV